MYYVVERITPGLELEHYSLLNAKLIYIAFAPWYPDDMC